MKIFCRKIFINQPEWLKAEGPVLLACNHPNSFLDGLILTLLFERDIYCLARGDAFRNKKYEKLLRWLHLLPVYRTSEGVENLEQNYATFEACLEIFEQRDIVIIFSEGRCVNEWHLRPLKKGTARLATTAWLQGIDLQVIPVGLNYNAFRNFGKNVVINFGRPLDKQEVLDHVSDGKMFASFNDQLKQELQSLVFEIDGNDKTMLHKTMSVHQPISKKILLALPAIAGLLVHAPLYFSIKFLNGIYFDNDHFDSTMVGLLLLCYPLYLLLFFIIGVVLFGLAASVLFVLLMPFCAWSCVQLKPQI